MLAVVDFLSLDSFLGLRPDADRAVISIGDPDDDAPAALLEYPHTLRLQFLDIEPGDAAAMSGAALFTQAQADQVVEFVRDLHARAEPVRLVVHCRMGASRSAAVALIAHAVTGCAFPRWPEANYANRYVVRLGEQALGACIEVPEFFVPDTDDSFVPRLPI
ncbi:dual specificity protein phosphatase family protein [Burkholderia ambifaria]|uniref:dual specificity protein phosphatase family protein n=1 Tax=Burkholderia ambifaria TaxID=152480 RepID=UPI000F80D92B|nr:dual specificity protein phosphatase family protein [Burkholderia ambifaria]